MWLFSGSNEKQVSDAKARVDDTLVQFHSCVNSLSSTVEKKASQPSTVALVFAGGLAAGHFDQKHTPNVDAKQHRSAHLWSALTFLFSTFA